MKRFIFTLLLIPISTVLVSAKNWYVSGTGNDANNGNTLAGAFRNPQKAASVVQPGDIVWIGNGIYTNPDKAGAVLSITKPGKPDAWITWKAMAGQHPQIKPTGWAGISITTSYQIVDGITVTGVNDAIVLLDAQEDAKKATPNPYFNTNGIFINGRPRKADEKPHHNIIRNCVVNNCPGGGIAAIETDYVTIQDCRVFNNAWFMRYGGSGITTLLNWAHDAAPGYHIIIQRNYVWNNKTMVSWEKIGKLSDGNGIILDVTDQEDEGATNPNADVVVKPSAQQAATPTAQDKPKRPEWKGRALIANNLSAYNGGSGIHTFRTKYVDIVNNTTDSNGGNVGYPEMFANSSEDIVFLNNIIVPRPAGKVTSNHKNSNIKWDYNLYPIAQSFFKGEHDIIASPQFIAVDADLAKSNFSLAKGSPALNSASVELPQATDINGKSRPKMHGRDRGAFEQ
jgi:hypothetical protein